MPGQPRRFLERLPLAREAPVLRYGATVALAVLATVLRFVVSDALPPGYPYLTYFPAIIFSAFLFGPGPGVLCALLSGGAALYFFIGPVLGFDLDFAIVVSLSFFAMVASIDIALVHWMQSANRRLLAERERSHRLAENRALLFRELQHRVSNNLQVVAALLALERRHIDDETARAALDASSRRLGLIGRIQRQLYDEAGRIGLASDFLRQLGQDVLAAAGVETIALTIEADDTIRFDPDMATPVALIVGEAIANAVEHGFAGRAAGTIAIRLERNGPGGAILTIEDDGQGLPPGFSLESSTSLGLRITTMLAKQLDGAFTLTGGERTCARLALPLPA